MMNKSISMDRSQLSHNINKIIEKCNKSRKYITNWNFVILISLFGSAATKNIFINRTIYWYNQ